MIRKLSVLIRRMFAAPPAAVLILHDDVLVFDPLLREGFFSAFTPCFPDVFALSDTGKNAKNSGVDTNRPPVFYPILVKITPDFRTLLSILPLRPVTTSSPA